ncbi:hypothetical protein EVAR_29817_1 [Eumeta japonica]|uniref:Uncharacterized protein n=1 Tax=Eumeta variegata TaxID=151549 RepID=A0A4C1VUM0_EUMVA|nr:hypothetical protein EVAR_29817_1 [Eumeta japonica]
MPTRFKLKDSPYCACDPAKIQDVLHVFEESPMFYRDRVALEAEIGVIVGRRNFPAIMDDNKSREKFIRFCDTATRAVPSGEPLRVFVTPKFSVSVFLQRRSCMQDEYSFLVEKLSCRQAQEDELGRVPPGSPRGHLCVLRAQSQRQ